MVQKDSSTPKVLKLPFVSVKHGSESILNIAQWAESGGQGDLGQIFIKNVNFQEGRAQNKTPITLWLQKTTDQSFQMRYFKFLLHTIADFV